MRRVDELTSTGCSSWSKYFMFFVFMPPLDSGRAAAGFMSCFSFLLFFFFLEFFPFFLSLLTFFHFFSIFYPRAFFLMYCTFLLLLLSFPLFSFSSSSFSDLSSILHISCFNAFFLFSFLCLFLFLSPSSSFSFLLLLFLLLLLVLVLHPPRQWQSTKPVRWKHISQINCDLANTELRWRLFPHGAPHGQRGR